MGILSHVLYKVRSQLGLSVADLARRSGLSKSVIYAIERNNGKHHINDSTAHALASATGKTVEELFQPQELSDRGRPPFTGQPIGSSDTSSLRGQTDICPGGCNLVLPANRVCDIHGDMSHYHYRAE